MRRCSLTVLILMAVAISGCARDSGGPKTTKAGGKVSLNGTPVEGANVSFSPQAGGRSAVGKTDAEGRFTLATTGAIGGVVPGEYQVGVSKEKTEGGMTPEESEAHFKKTGQAPPAPKVTNELPEKYKNPATSGLKAKVEEGGVNDFNFELTK